MTLTIDLTADEEKRLEQEAHRRGLKPNEYAKELLAGGLPAKPSANQNLWNTLTPQEWEQQVDDWLKNNQSLPVLSEYSVSRESMYEERE